MKAPDIPFDEESRLQALHALGVLDTPEEERFDRLTRLARQLFGVPIALVSLVDAERQWFKSRNGLELHETPRSVAFSAHAILADDIFIVEDAGQDPRFADNPLVTGEPFIRFYAGCPLHGAAGARVGTLCIVDRNARSLSADQRQALQDLAALAERELAAADLAISDELTGINNRRGFLLLGRYGLECCARQQAPASAVFLDLDGFKEINDRYGRAEGDRVLVDFARMMSTIFRNSDLFARLGGDEFVALLADTSADQATSIIRRLQQALDDYNQQAQRDYQVGFSFGIVEVDPNQHETVADLLAESDRAMLEGRPASG